MKNLAKTVKKIENKPPLIIVKICLGGLLVSLVVGTCLGFIFRELRLRHLSQEQIRIRAEEDQKLNTLFDKFSGNKIYLNR